MNNALTVYNTESGEVRLSPETIKNYLVSGNGNVTDQEIMMFLNLCKYQKLNPFLREAYLIKFGQEQATIVTGKEVFTKRASKNPICDGWNAGVVVVNEKGDLIYRAGTLVLKTEELVGGWCEVKRKDWSQVQRNEVSLEEYMRTNRDGKPMAQWAKMPATMIRKVAIVQALRDAFPEDLQGLYSQEEMPVDATRLDTMPVEVIEKQEESKPDCISQAQAKRMFGISQGNTKLVKETLLKYNYTNSADVKKTDYEKICADIEAGTKTETVQAEAVEALPWDTK